MDKTIRHNNVRGEISAPPSKSMTIRAFAGAMLSHSVSEVSNYSVCDDAQTALEIIKTLGSKVDVIDNRIKIIGGKPSQNTTINCGESALCLRLFSVISALYNFPIELHAEKTLLSRPTEKIDEIFHSLGVNFKSNNERPPFVIHGPIKGGKIIIDCSKSSQLLSGLLFALPLASDNSIIEVENLKSKPYVDMTLEVLSTFGIKILNNNYKKFEIDCNQKYQSAKLNIEGDWSCASNFLVSAAISGNIKINNLNKNSKQGDKIILDVLSQVGANVLNEDNSVRVSSNELKPFTFNACDHPDLVPILAVLGCFCNGVSDITDIARLSGKESSRAEIIAKELNSIGGKITLENDNLKIHKSSITGGRVDSHGDHRIAMALAIAGLSSKENVIIVNAECTSKSYPDFWKDFEHVTQI